MLYRTDWRVKVRIPTGYKLNSLGNFQNSHGVEYQIVRYRGPDGYTYCLETIYSNHVRTVELQIM